MDDVMAGAAQVRDDARRDPRGLVVGVVEDLDLEPIARVVEGAGGADQPRDDVDLV